MPFLRPSVNTIYERIKSDIETRVNNNVTIPAFSLNDILARVFAGSIHLCYGVLVWLSKQFFADSAEDDYLVRLAELNGITRRPATFSTAEGVFQETGPGSTFLPKGTQVESPNGLIFETIDNANTDLVPALTVIPVQCLTEGESGNVPSFEATLVDPSSFPTVDSELIVTTTGGGVDQESIEALRERLRIYLSQRPAGGRKQDYELWALEISGVDKVWVFDVYVGAGTVGIVISDIDFQPVSTPIKQEVQDNINSNGPLGVKKDVLDPVPKPVTWSISLSENTDVIKDKIEENMLELFNLSSSPGGTILISSMRNAISNSGVNDYDITAMTYDGSSISVGNITAVNFDLPYPESYTYSDL